MTPAPVVYPDAMDRFSVTLNLLLQAFPVATGDQNLIAGFFSPYGGMIGIPTVVRLTSRTG